MTPSRSDARVGRTWSAVPKWLVWGALCVGCGPEASPGTRVPPPVDGTSSDLPVPSPVDAVPVPAATVPRAEGSSATAAVASTPLPATTAAVATDAPAKTSAATTTAVPPVGTALPAAGGLKDITFEHLKFNIEKGQTFERKMLTPEVERLEGARIRIRGFILPQSMLQSTGAKEFVFVRDNGECCFGPGAALYDCMRVEMAPDKTADFNVLPIALEGTLTFDPLEFGGQTLALFFLKDAVVR